MNFLESQDYQAREFNILTDAFQTKYDLIFAIVVFLHFNPEELESVFQKTHAALSESRVLAFSVKKGKGENWITEKLENPRYYCYWTLEELLPKLLSSGYEIHNTLEDEKYILIIARKI